MKKVALIILDGWGKGDGTHSDAIAHAQIPFMKHLMATYPHSSLLTSGENVGLPDGQMGNSEVGHLNIGAGRIVYQDLAKINKEVRENTIDNNPVLNKAFEHAIKNNVPIHLMGLVSDGGVHSHQEHLHKLCSLAANKGVKNVFIHAFTDGRDTDPKSGLGYIKKLEKGLTPLGRQRLADGDASPSLFGEGRIAQIASVVGRYYSMDRDKRWERVKLAYDLLVKGEGEKFTSATQAIEASYAQNITDEFIKPVVCTDSNGQPLATIKEGDVVICFNFRTDRCREITQVLTQQDMPEQGMKKLNLYYVTMTNYDNTFKNVQVVYDKDNLEMTLGEVLEKNNKTQIRIAETEKYPHVTFFFSGGREKEFKGERRILIPSPKVATYDLKPEMSANEVAEAIINEIQPETRNLKPETANFVCLNFANPDMVGHTGDYKAVIKALETVDSCLKKVVEAGLKNDYSFIIIADHGNADYMVNSDGSPNTAHTTNPVPCILIDKDYKKVKDGILADIAPTILKLMEVAQPTEMSGKSLV